MECPGCFIWNCSYIFYPLKMQGPFRDNCLRYFYLRSAFLMVGCVEGIRRALFQGLVLIAGTTVVHACSFRRFPHNLVNCYYPLFVPVHVHLHNI